MPCHGIRGTALVLVSLEVHIKAEKLNLPQGSPATCQSTFHSREHRLGGVRRPSWCHMSSPHLTATCYLARYRTRQSDVFCAGSHWSLSDTVRAVTALVSLSGTKFDTILLDDRTFVRRVQALCMGAPSVPDFSVYHSLRRGRHAVLAQSYKQERSNTSLLLPPPPIISRSR